MNNWEYISLKLGQVSSICLSTNTSIPVVQRIDGSQQTIQSIYILHWCILALMKILLELYKCYYILWLGHPNQDKSILWCLSPLQGSYTISQKKKKNFKDFFKTFKDLFLNCPGPKITNWQQTFTATTCSELCFSLWLKENKLDKFCWKSLQCQI